MQDFASGQRPESQREGRNSLKQEKHGRQSLQQKFTDVLHKLEGEQVRYRQEQVAPEMTGQTDLRPNPLPSAEQMDSEANIQTAEEENEPFILEDQRIEQMYTIEPRKSVPLPPEKIQSTMTVSVSSKPITGRMTEIGGRVRSNTSMNALAGIAVSQKRYSRQKSTARMREKAFNVEDNAMQLQLQAQKTQMHFEMRNLDSVAAFPLQQQSRSMNRTYQGNYPQESYRPEQSIMSDNENVETTSRKSNYLREKKNLLRELSQTFKSNDTLYGRINVLKKREEQSKKKIHDALKAQQAMEESMKRKQTLQKRKQQLKQKVQEEMYQKVVNTQSAKKQRDEAAAKRRKDKEEYAAKVYAIESRRAMQRKEYLNNRKTMELTHNKAMYIKGRNSQLSLKHQKESLNSSFRSSISSNKKQSMKSMSAEVARQKRKVANLEQQEKILSDNLMNTMRIEKAITQKFGVGSDTKANQQLPIRSQAQLINSVMKSSHPVSLMQQDIQDQSPTAPTQASSRKLAAKKSYTGPQKKEAAQRAVNKHVESLSKKVMGKALDQRQLKTVAHSKKPSMLSQGQDSALTR